VQEIKGLTEAEMLALVKQRLATSSTFKDHAFVFVHGFNTSFDNALYRTAQIAYDLRFDGVPFLYSWPSGGKVTSYTYDHGSVEQAEPRLAEFLDMVIQKSGAKSISLIAHSMGNELLLRVLERMKTKVPRGVVISQVILAAPDVDRDKFNILAREVIKFAKGVTLYAASNDRALSYSARFWGGVPRAGDVPASGPLIIPGLDTIDVTAVSTDALGLNHSGYAENPALLNDVKALVASDFVRPTSASRVSSPLTRPRANIGGSRRKRRQCPSRRQGSWQQNSTQVLRRRRAWRRRVAGLSKSRKTSFTRVRHSSFEFVQYSKVRHAFCVCKAACVGCCCSFCFGVGKLRVRRGRSIRR
jgi:esterase/lipase superfamily enzyme